MICTIRLAFIGSESMRRLIDLILFFLWNILISFDEKEVPLLDAAIAF